MSGSTIESRGIIIAALSRCGQPIEADDREGIVLALGVNLSKGVIFGTLDSFRYGPHTGVHVTRTGSSEGGMARGWRIGLC